MIAVEPIFLTLDEVVEIHSSEIELHGGSHGIRDLGLLQSALAMPAAGFGDNYLHETLFDKAAAYLFHLVKNHPFIDGNKRVGLATASVFLMLNGVEKTADQDAFADRVLAVAEGRAGKLEIAAFLAKHTSPAP